MQGVGAIRLQCCNGEKRLRRGNLSMSNLVPCRRGLALDVGMRKRPQVAALLGLSKPEMEIAIQLRYSFVVKHLPELCLGLYHFRTWSKESHL